MALSGSTNFEPNVAEFVEEAFERCGLELRTGYDLKTARRSINLMLAEWANRGLNQWTIEQATQTVTEGTTDYSLNSNIIDILDVVLRRTVNQTQTDFFDKLSTPTLKIWPAPENSTDILVFNKIVRMDDADKPTNTMDMPFRFFPCFAAGLAYYIAMKRAPDRIQLLETVYEEEFKRAMAEDRDRSAFNVVPKLDYYKVG